MNANEVEVPPPGAGVKTVTVALPKAAISFAEICAVIWVLLTNVVGRLLPFHWTTEVGTKPVPVTVSVKVEPPTLALTGESALRVGDALGGGGVVVCEDCPHPHTPRLSHEQRTLNNASLTATL